MFVWSQSLGLGAFNVTSKVSGLVFVGSNEAKLTQNNAKSPVWADPW